MTNHMVATREEWQAARDELLMPRSAPARPARRVTAGPGSYVSFRA